MLANEYILIVLFTIIFCPGLTFSIELHNIFLSLVILFGCGYRLTEHRSPAQQKAVAVSRHVKQTVSNSKVFGWLSAVVHHRS
jgi:hypothetical protein